MSIKTEIKLVTPVLAEGWLKKNPRNRSMNDRTVREYTTDMLQGRWKCNGDAIRFDVNGNIVDGQHRLKAIVLSKMPQNMVLITGLDPEVFDSIDIGRGRSSANAMEVMKIPNFNRVASALAVIAMYDRGVSSKVRDRIRPNHAIELLDRYSDLPDAIVEIGASKSVLIARSLFDGLYYVFRRRDKQMAMEYMVALRDGVGIDTLDAWLQLRERLIRNSTAIHKLDEVNIAALIIKGWNYARQGRDSTKLVWSPNKEDFPEAV